MPREKRPPREARIEVRVRSADKDLFESYLSFNESLSNWLYVAGLERVERLRAAAPRPDGAPPAPPPGKKPRRKR